MALRDLLWLTHIPSLVDLDFKVKSAAVAYYWDRLYKALARFRSVTISVPKGDASGPSDLQGTQVSLK